ncbi:unnamed protein product [Vitrella brassicaformis CCMP3155]|uniref:Uncharacterized protein n=1 Tax=Vitrella brassicaformis (strain CCMP3155) TaxID=1169540 RepID=A0A0G4FF32_VITBC|nr:unnamed protein product [Vitrella brassicaformis CCMP3155]|eukprot:CEM11451.1 unnamed protein product [Vitrella brassicaformis CCMP3155]
MSGVRLIGGATIDTGDLSRPSDPSPCTASPCHPPFEPRKRFSVVTKGTKIQDLSVASAIQGLFRFSTSLLSFGGSSRQFLSLSHWFGEEFEFDAALIKLRDLNDVLAIWVCALPDTHDVIQRREQRIVVTQVAYESGHQRHFSLYCTLPW